MAKTTHRKRRVRRLAAVALVWLTGCAGTFQAPHVLDGPVAIVAAGFAPEAAIDVLAQGKRAAAGKMGAGGAGGGVLAGAVAPLGAGPVGIVAYPIIAPFTILVGALAGGAVGVGYGMIHGLPENQAVSVRELVDKALAELAIQEQIPHGLEARLLRAGEPTHYLPGIGPAAAGDRPDYAVLREQGYRAVLETAVVSIGMAATKGDPPRIAFEMKLRTRLVVLADGGSSAERILEYRSRPRVLAAWAEDGGRLLAEEFTLAYSTLEQYAMEIYFLPVVMRE